MTPQAACAIIAAYGGDARRWPVAVRPSLLVLAASNAEVAAAIAAERQFDGLLDDWAAAPVDTCFDLGAITRQDQVRPMPMVASAPIRPARRWLAGGALVAALVGIVVLAPQPHPRMPATPQLAAATPAPNLVSATVPSATVESEAARRDADAFAKVFTPTSDEDELI